MHSLDILLCMFGCVWDSSILWKKLGGIMRAQECTPVFFLESPMYRGAWQATIHRVVELDTTEATEDAHTHAHMLTNTIPNCWMWKTKQLLYYYTDITTFQDMEGDLTTTTL